MKDKIHPLQCIFGFQAYKWWSLFLFYLQGIFSYSCFFIIIAATLEKYETSL